MTVQSILQTSNSSKRDKSINAKPLSNEGGFCYLAYKVSLPAREFFTGDEFHAFVCAVVDADTFVFDDALAKHGQQVVLFRNEVDGLQGLWDGASLNDGIEQFALRGISQDFPSLFDLCTYYFKLSIRWHDK